MKEVIAYCGIKCNECPVYIATNNNDTVKKEKIAKSWSTEDYPLEPMDVECHGCTSGKVIISFCDGCDIRECGVDKKTENCGVCKEYPCDKLNKVFEKSIDSKAMLDDINDDFLKQGVKR